MSSTLQFLSDKRVNRQRLFVMVVLLLAIARGGGSIGVGIARSFARSRQLIVEERRISNCRNVADAASSCKTIV
jgi:hypothetical protein